MRSGGAAMSWSTIFLLCSLIAVNALLHTRDLDGQLLDSYDYIVVGCGISGLVVANRLSEIESRTVLCVEAGPADHYEQIVQVPVFVGADVGGEYDWNLLTTPQTQLDGAPRPMPQGKALGGGSILNAMCWNRGGADDYDAWEQLGNPGWGWDGILPYFRKSETYTPFANPMEAEEYSINYNSAVHGFDGPVQVSYPKYLYPQSSDIVEVNLFAAMNQLGLPSQFDPNDGTSAGPAFVPTDIDPNNQTRSDARRAYFDPYASRENFHVITGQHVTRIIIQGVANSSVVSNPSDGGNESGNGPSNGNNQGFGFGPQGSNPRLPNQPPPMVTKRQDPASSNLRIEGVEFAANASAPRRTIYATREVIVAAGALHSAQLMELSGIGSASLLQQHNIPLAVDLPGVGNNLQDHCLVGTFYPYNNASFPSPTELTINATYNSDAEAEYYAHKTGPWPAGSPNALAFNPLPLITNNSWIILYNATYQNPTDYLPPNTDPSLVMGYAAQKDSLVPRLGQNHVAAYEIINNNAGSLTLAVMHPLSRGTTHIASADPFEPPAIDPRWLTNPVDRQVLVEALRFNRQILATPPMQELQPAQFVPPVDADEEGLDQVINNGIRTEFHPSGTLAMLPLELGGVVNSHLTVYGTQNLRVVDAGIMPMIPAAHLQAVVYAVAEKAADIIKQDNLPASSVPTSTSSAASPTITASRNSTNPTGTGVLGATKRTSSPSIVTANYTVPLLRRSRTNSVIVTPASGRTSGVSTPTSTSLAATSADSQIVSSPIAVTSTTAPSSSRVLPRSVQTFATTGLPTASPGGKVLVFTTTLPAFLPSYLSSLKLHPDHGPASPAETAFANSADELSASIAGVLTSAGFPSAAVSTLAPIIIGQDSGGSQVPTGEDDLIQQEQRLAATEAILNFVLKFFDL